METAVRLTEQVKLEQAVLQGTTWGPDAMASVQVDSFDQELLEEDHFFPYKYKGYIHVGILGQIDDVMGVSEAGYKAQQLNTVAEYI